MGAGLESPTRASSLMCATSCHVRPKILSFSCSRITGSRYAVEGSVEARATSVSSFIDSGAIVAFTQNAAVERASLAVVNGHVWPPHRRTSAVAIVNDRIFAVGSDQAVRSLCSRHTRVIDARGGSILPAFNDAHVHFLMASRSLGQLDLYGAETQTEVERRVAGYVARHGGPWVVG